MRKLLWIAVALIALHGCKAKEKVTEEIKYSVSGILTQTSQYCRGAPPTPEMEAELRKKRPHNIPLYVKKGSANSLEAPVIVKIEPDAEGKFTVNLPDGDYCILMEFQTKEIDLSEVKENRHLRVDDECFAKKWAECFGSFSVKGKDVTGIELNVRHRCFVPDLPCVQFDGPMPP